MELRPLNAIIGPNASGKSNLVAAIGLLKAAPGSLQDAIRRGGGIREWISKAIGGVTGAGIECDIQVTRWPKLRYSIVLAERSLRLYVDEEAFWAPTGQVFERSFGSARFYTPADKTFREISSLAESASFLAHYKDPADGTPITDVGEAFESIRTRAVHSGTDAAWTGQTEITGLPAFV